MLPFSGVALLVVVVAAILAGCFGDSLLARGKLCERLHGLIGLALYAGLMWLLAPMLLALLQFNTELFAFLSVAINTIILYVLSVGGTLLVAAIFENNPDGLWRRFTGAGSSAGFWVGNLFQSFYIAISLLAIRNLNLPNTWWPEMVVVAAMMIGYFIVRGDTGYYNVYNETAAADHQTSVLGPAKVYHDFVVQCVFVYAQLMTVVWFVGVAAIGINNRTLFWDQIGPYILPLFVGVIVQMTICLRWQKKLGPLDYGKLHPASWRR